MTTPIDISKVKPVRRWTILQNFQIGYQFFKEETKTVPYCIEVEIKPVGQAEERDNITDTYGKGSAMDKLNDILKTTDRQLMEALKERNAAQAEVEKLKKESKEFLGQLTYERRHASDQYRIVELEAEVEKLKKENGSLRGSRNFHQNCHDGLVEEMNEIKAQNVQLRNEVKSLNNENEDLVKTLSQADGLVDRLTQENEQLRAKLDKYENALQGWWDAWKNDLIGYPEDDPTDHAFEYMSKLYPFTASLLSESSDNSPNANKASGLCSAHQYPDDSCKICFPDASHKNSAT